MFAFFSTLKTNSMTAYVGTLTTIVMAVLGWAININSKVNVTQQQQADVKDLIHAQRDLLETKFSVIINRFDDFDGRLERLERHVLNGHYGDKN